MKPKEFKVNGITYVPKQEERKQNIPLLNIRVDEGDGFHTVTVEANGNASEILAAWSNCSCSLFDRIGLDLSAAFAALMAAKVILHNRSEG